MSDVDRIVVPLEIDRAAFKQAIYVFHARTPQREYAFGAVAVLGIMAAVFAGYRATFGAVHSPSLALGFASGSLAFLGLVNTLGHFANRRTFKAHQDNAERSGPTTAGSTRMVSCLRAETRRTVSPGRPSMTSLP